jgi:hypothetical protein
MRSIIEQNEGDYFPRMLHGQPIYIAANRAQLETVLARRRPRGERHKSALFGQHLSIRRVRLRTTKRRQIQLAVKNYF